MGDDYLDAPSSALDGLRLLAQQIPTFLHFTSLGLASSSAVERRRVEKVARVIDRMRPERWSEHLAFVRAGRMELGHLTAPPRTDQTLEGLQRNVTLCREIVGSAPVLENIASLVELPLHDYDEAEWLERVVAATGVELLFDLHNLHANAANGAFDAERVVRRVARLPIAYVHLAGGRLIRAGRRMLVLDDHLHAVPDEAFALLRVLAEERDEPLSVVIERDGNYAPIDEMIEEIERARQVLSDAAAVSA